MPGLGCSQALALLSSASQQHPEQPPAHLGGGPATSGLSVE